MSAIRESISRRQMIALAGLTVFGTASADTMGPDLQVHSNGTASLGEMSFRCALGRTGVNQLKREGDGATPIGTFPLRRLFYRADRMSKPVSVLPTRRLYQNDGWCDAPGDRNYNRLIKHPYVASAERLWRADSVYDIIVVVGYNDAPVIPGRGSAIFLHLARPDYSPTAGCIALKKTDLLQILTRLTLRSRVIVSL